MEKKHVSYKILVTKGQFGCNIEHYQFLVTMLNLKSEFLSQHRYVYF